MIALPYSHSTWFSRNIQANIANNIGAILLKYGNSSSRVINICLNYTREVTYFIEGLLLPNCLPVQVINARRRSWVISLWVVGSAKYRQLLNESCSQNRINSWKSSLHGLRKVLGRTPSFPKATKYINIQFREFMQLDIFDAITNPNKETLCNECLRSRFLSFALYKFKIGDPFHFTDLNLHAHKREPASTGCKDASYRPTEDGAGEINRDITSAANGENATSCENAGNGADEASQRPNRTTFHFFAPNKSSCKAHCVISCNSLPLIVKVCPFSTQLICAKCIDFTHFLVERVPRQIGIRTQVQFLLGAGGKYFRKTCIINCNSICQVRQIYADHLKSQLRRVLNSLRFHTYDVSIQLLNGLIDFIQQICLNGINLRSHIHHAGEVFSGDGASRFFEKVEGQFRSQRGLSVIMRREDRLIGRFPSHRNQIEMIFQSGVNDILYSLFARFRSHIVSANCQKCNHDGRESENCAEETAEIFENIVPRVPSESIGLPLDSERRPQNGAEGCTSSQQCHGVPSINLLHGTMLPTHAQVVERIARRAVGGRL